MSDQVATYSKTPFSIGGQYHYVEIEIPRINTTAGNNIICCVDISGSMSGGPIKNVSEVLRDIYRRTNVKYPLFTYNNVASTNQTIESVKNRDLISSGGTSFASIFKAIQNHLVQNQKSVTFIFMTDGQDMDSATALNAAIQLLRLTVNALPKSVVVTIHVIGFGSVNDKFLNQVRRLGSREGLFRYSTESAELQNNFNDMFEYAMSAREFTLTIETQTFSANSNGSRVAFLIKDTIIDLENVREVRLTSNDAEKVLPLQSTNTDSAIQHIRALNLVEVENQDSVDQIRQYLSMIPPGSGANVTERLDVEVIREEINTRMLEYTRLFTQIREGQIPEMVRLRLSALKHEAKFADAQRNRLDLRVGRNVDYFVRTDIQGILDGYKRSIDKQGWRNIEEHKSDWICTYSMDNIYEMMRKSADNIMCLGIRIERNEQAIISPTKGLKLLYVSNTLITYDSFISAITLARNSQEQEVNNRTHGQGESVNDRFCTVDQSREQINAVIPLYINDEHMKRIRILEGIWLGYLFTLNPLGYDSQQEIGLLTLLYDMIILHTGTTRYQQILTEFERVCHFIVTESVGFKSAYGERTYENFLQSIHYRQNGTYDLRIPLTLGYLKKDLYNVLMPVFYEYLRRRYHKKVSTDTEKTPKDQKKTSEASVETSEDPLIMSTDRMAIVKQLLYGDESQQVTTVAKNEHRTDVQVNESDPDYVEQTFIDYFHDEMNMPFELIPESTTEEYRKLIINEADAEFIKSLLVNVPVFIKDFLKCTRSDKDFIEEHLNFEDLRRELLMILYYDRVVPSNVTKSNVMAMIDSEIQGKQSIDMKSINESEREIFEHLKNRETILLLPLMRFVVFLRSFSGDRDDNITRNYTPEQIRIVSYKILTAKTLEGFAGLMRRYCSKRCGSLFMEVVKNLMNSSQGTGNLNVILNKEKLVALLTNEIGYSRLYVNEVSSFCWQPLTNVDIDQLSRIVGKEEFDRIERNNLNKPVLHCYRLPNKSNRSGHSNFRPYMGNQWRFTGYRDRH